MWAPDTWLSLALLGPGPGPVWSWVLSIHRQVAWSIDGYLSAIIVIVYEYFLSTIILPNLNNWHATAVSVRIRIEYSIIYKCIHFWWFTIFDSVHEWPRLHACKRHILSYVSCYENRRKSRSFTYIGTYTIPRSANIANRHTLP